MIVSTVCARIYEIKETKTEGLCSQLNTDEKFSQMFCWRNRREDLAWRCELQLVCTTGRECAPQNLCKIFLHKKVEIIEQSRIIRGKVFRNPSM